MIHDPLNTRVRKSASCTNLDTRVENRSLSEGRSGSHSSPDSRPPSSGPTACVGSIGTIDLGWDLSHNVWWLAPQGETKKISVGGRSSSSPSASPNRFWRRSDFFFLDRTTLQRAIQHLFTPYARPSRSWPFEARSHNTEERIEPVEVDAVG